MLLKIFRKCHVFFEIFRKCHIFNYSKNPRVFFLKIEYTTWFLGIFVKCNVFLIYFEKVTILNFGGKTKHIFFILHVLNVSWWCSTSDAISMSTIFSVHNYTTHVGKTRPICVIVVCCVSLCRLQTLSPKPATGLNQHCQQGARLSLLKTGEQIERVLCGQGKGPQAEMRVSATEWKARLKEKSCIRT